MLLTNEEVQAIKPARISQAKVNGERIIAMIEANIEAAKANPKITVAGVDLKEIQAEMPEVNYIPSNVVTMVREYFGAAKCLTVRGKFPTDGNPKNTHVIAMGVKVK